MRINLAVAPDPEADAAKVALPHPVGTTAAHDGLQISKSGRTISNASDTAITVLDENRSVRCVAAEVMGLLKTTSLCVRCADAGIEVTVAVDFSIAVNPMSSPLAIVSAT